MTRAALAVPAVLAMLAAASHLARAETLVLTCQGYVGDHQCHKSEKQF